MENDHKMTKISAIKLLRCAEDVKPNADRMSLLECKRLTDTMEQNGNRFEQFESRSLTVDALDRYHHLRMDLFKACGKVDRLNRLLYNAKRDEDAVCLAVNKLLGEYNITS